MREFDVRWENFRSFEDTGWLSIRPVTVLIGPNNSGKTSVIAPLLLLKQTLESRDPSVGLLTSGPLINVGSYRDLVLGRELGRPVALSIRFHSHELPKGAEVRPLGGFAPGVAEFVFGPANGTVILEEYQVSDFIGRRMLRRRLLESGRYSLEGLAKSARGLRVGRGASGEIRKDEYLREIRKALPQHFLFEGGEIVATVVEKTVPTGHRSGDRITFAMSRETLAYLGATGLVESAITDLLNEIAYLGPLRERPKRSYELSGEIPPDVGIKGEFAPEILFRRQGKALVRDVQHWLEQFQFPRVIDYEAIGEGTFSLRIRVDPAAAPTNFADCGFGVSQVLPLIVQALYSEEDSLLIAEQPEIHLNPRLQAMLADLFVDTAAKGRAVLCETHSEHLLLRLRRLIAEGRVPPGDVALYFVEKVRGRSRVREIPLREDGYIDPGLWPKGFFEDSLREAVALASQQTRLRQSAS